MNRRAKVVVLFFLVLLLTTIVALPRIIEAKRAKSTDQNFNAIPLTMQDNSEDQRADISVVASYHNDTSKPLRDIKPHPLVPKAVHENENPHIPNKHKDTADPVVQKSFSFENLMAANMPSTILSFNGIGFPGVACNCAPPDTNGEVGATQYVQMVNEGIQVFDKTTGATVLGPVGITTIWNGFNGPCETAGDGDPGVLYDQLANPWVLSP